jgi:hypothetical protein
MTFQPIRIGNTVITRKAKTKDMYEIRNDMSPHLMKSIKVSSFEATDVMTLREYLKRNDHITELYVALCLAHDLGRQMQSLILGGHGIACFGPDDVVIITHRSSDAFTHKDPDVSTDNDPQFLFLNDHLIFEVDESDGSLLIDRALKTSTAFLSPEMLTQSPPVHRVHFKTAYYSAARLIIYFLLNVVANEPTAEDLHPIKDTKLYWFLLRCLNPAPSERNYIYI